MKRSVGFVLPTVVVSSIVLMIVLLAALQLASSSAAALRDQYYNTLAREAAEAGAVFMGECMKDNKFDQGVVVNPGDDCLGAARNPAMTNVFASSKIDIDFSGKYVLSGQNKTAMITGEVRLKRPSDGTVYKKYTHTARQLTTQEEGSTARATRRWWHIGQGAVVDFGINNKSPAVASRAVGPGSRETKLEGITTVSDKSGNLLFYSDGITVWDRNGEVMENSAGLSGTYTTTQAVASFPIDDDERYYVIVTNDAIQSTDQGVLSYSVIDMTLNGGRGGVLRTAKNIRLGYGLISRYGSEMAKYSSEALSAAPMPDGSGYWVYTYTPTPTNNVVWGFRFKRKQKTHPNYYDNPVDHDGSVSSVVRAYDVTASDYDKRSPVCEGVRNEIRQRTGYSYFDMRRSKVYGFGTINFNKDYSRMVIMMGGWDCKHKDSSTKYDYANYGAVHVLNVDRASGLLTKHASFHAGSRTTERFAISGAYTFRGYSADFSPDGRYIYTTTVYPGRVRRFDISDPDRVYDSMRFIGASSCTEYPGACSFQLNELDLEEGGYGGGQALRGPDDKVYVADAHTPWLSVIHQPDAPTPQGSRFDDTIGSSVGWQYGRYGGGLNLPIGTYSKYGLPQMVTTYSPRLIQY